MGHANTNGGGPTEGSGRWLWRRLMGAHHLVVVRTLVVITLIAWLLGIAHMGVLLLKLL